MTVVSTYIDLFILEESPGGNDSAENARLPSAPCGRPHRKLDPTDIVFSSAKKWASFCTRISSLNGIKSGHFSSI